MFRRRILWLIIILVSMSFYFPINRLAHGGIQLELPIDQHIPLFTLAIIPYLFGTIVFIGFPIWAAFNAGPREFEAYTVSVLSATVISYIVYLAFPTFVVRPEIVSTDVFSRLVGVLYNSDNAYNAAPSGHAFYTTLTFLYLVRWKPGYRWVWLVIAILILASTLLTRQHYVLDLVAGLILGVSAYFVGRAAQKKWGLLFGSRGMDGHPVIK